MNLQQYAPCFCRISVKARVQIYLDTNIYFSQSLRLCNHHVDNDQFLVRLFYDGMKSLNRPIRLQGAEVLNFFTELRNKALIKREEQLTDPNIFSDNQ